MRVFNHLGRCYALAIPGQFHGSADGFSRFEAGPKLFGPNARHMAVSWRGKALSIFWSRVRDAPEARLFSTVDLSRPWMEWRASQPVATLRPERAWKGAGELIEPSTREAVHGRVNQLCDPAILDDDGRTFLIYKVAGVSGIAVAGVHANQ